MIQHDIAVMEEVQIQQWYSINNTRSHRADHWKINSSSTNQGKSIHIAKVVCTSRGVSVYELLLHTAVLTPSKESVFAPCTPSEEMSVLHKAECSNHWTSMEMTQGSGQVEFYSIMLVTPHMNTASYTTTKHAKHTHNIFAWSRSQF